MNYEINVSKGKTHFYATAPRSLTTKGQMKEALKIFAVKFPKEEGYELTVMYERTTGTMIDVDKVLEEMKKPMMLIYKDSGVEVKEGDVVLDDDNKERIVYYFRKPSKPSSEGKVTVRKNNSSREIFVSGIGAEWINRDDR